MRLLTWGPCEGKHMECNNQKANVPAAPAEAQKKAEPTGKKPKAAPAESAKAPAPSAKVKAAPTAKRPKADESSAATAASGDTVDPASFPGFPKEAYPQQPRSGRLASKKSGS